MLLAQIIPDDLEQPKKSRNTKTYILSFALILEVDLEKCFLGKQFQYGLLSLKLAWNRISKGSF